MLSICIPTYSRANLLRECLDSIVVQFQNPAVASRVEIAVSDNASTDKTKELVAKYASKYPNFRYSRNETNLGYDRNVDAVLKFGQGQFRWLMSDDEMLLPEALNFLLPILEKYPEAGYFCVNHGGLDFKEDYKVFKDGNAWLQGLGLTGGLVSQNIYNSDFLPQDISKYFDNLWIHFSLALEITAKHPAVLVKKLFLDPPVERECRWAEGGHALMTYAKLNALLRSLKLLGYDPNIVNKLLRGMAGGLPKNVASAKIHNLKINQERFDMLVQEFRQYPLWLLFSLIVYFTPNFILKIIHSGKKFLNKD